MAKLDTYLEVLSHLNLGTNHGPDYGMCHLPDGGTAEDALADYFSSLYTSLTPKQPAGAWQIRVGPPADDGLGELSKAANHWFFEQEFSPKLCDGYAQAHLVERFIEVLQTEIGVPSVREVFVSPPMFYELVWQDFLLTTSSGRWLLHFGFAD